MNTQQMIQNTCDWALEHMGSREYTTLCLAFIEDALEKNNDIEIFGGDCARESAEMYRASERGGVPPKGAFVFYDCQGVYEGQPVNWGHCGLSLGDGKVIHAWDVVRVDDYLDVEKLTPAPHWT